MPEDTEQQVSTLRAVAHPLRLRILSLLTGTELSAAEIARELDVTHANASYHLRVLADADLVEEAGEEKIRGGVAKRYRHPWDRPDAPSPKPTAEDHDLYVRAMAAELVRRFAQRKSSDKTWLTDAEMWVTPAVWGEVLGHVQQASELIHAEAKLPRTKGTIHVNLTAALFEMETRG